MFVKWRCNTSWCEVSGELYPVCSWTLFYNIMKHEGLRMKKNQSDEYMIALITFKGPIPVGEANQTKRGRRNFKS